MDKNTLPANFFTFSKNREENTPTFSEGKQEWINYGLDNQYGEYLIELLNTSSKHNSLVRKKVNMTAGKGFIETPENATFIENGFGKEDCNEIAVKNAWDLMTYGGGCFAVTWSKDKKSIARKSYVDFSKVRIAKQLDDDSEMAKRQAEGVEYFYVSADWSKPKKEKNIPELIQGFDERYKDELTQLVWFTEYRPGVDYYTYPDYISSVDWIELDREIANFHLSSVKNGFTPSMVISFNGGIPTDEEMKDIKKKLTKQYAGTDNGSEVFVTFSESKDRAPEFIPINLNASDERFLQLEEQIQQNIIVAHGASPIVAGVAISGKLGSSDEVIEAETVFNANVIEQKQVTIERAFNKIAAINGVPDLELQGVESFESEVIEEAVDGVVTPIDVEAEAKANLRGSVGGVTGILDIAAQVANGTISYLSGQSILEVIFGLSPEDAKRVLGVPPTEEEINENKTEDNA